MKTSTCVSTMPVFLAMSEIFSHVLWNPFMPSGLVYPHKIGWGHLSFQGALVKLEIEHGLCAFTKK